jgi:hypothetical protein
MVPLQWSCSELLDPWSQFHFPVPGAARTGTTRADSWQRWRLGRPLSRGFPLVRYDRNCEFWSSITIYAMSMPGGASSRAMLCTRPRKANLLMAKGADNSEQPTLSGQPEVISPFIGLDKKGLSKLRLPQAPSPLPTTSATAMAARRRVVVIRAALQGGSRQSTAAHLSGS